MRINDIEISERSIEMLKFMNPYGATIEELIDKFSVSFDARICELLKYQLITGYTTKKDEPISCYILTHKGEIYLEDLNDSINHLNIKRAIEFLKWFLPLIISIIALIVSVTKR